jgi:hypothetical protein
MSSSVLPIRLTELEEAGLVQHTNGTGSVLSAIGHKLRAASPPDELAGTPVTDRAKRHR